MSKKILAATRCGRHDLDIIRWWWRHYRPCDMRAIAFFIEEEEEFEDFRETIDAAAEDGVYVKIYQIKRYSHGETVGKLEEHVQEMAGWNMVLHADADELMRDLPAALEAARGTRGFAWAGTQMVDRLGPGGSVEMPCPFPPSDLTKSGHAVVPVSDMGELDTYYPVRARVTKDIAKACSFKACFGSSVTGVHNPIDGDKAAGRFELPASCTLEHFKWRRGVQGRILKRLSDWEAADVPWGDEGKRALDAIKDGKFEVISCKDTGWEGTSKKVLKQYSSILVRASEEIHGWNKDYTDLYADVARWVPDGGKIVEVGSWMGRSAAFLKECLDAYGKSVEIYCVDPFREFAADKTGYPQGLRNLVTGHSWVDIFSANLKRANALDMVHVVQFPSPRPSRLFDNGSLDFVWIDGAHDVESVRRDCEAWWHKVKPGGVLAGHDYGRHQVKAGVNRSGIKAYGELLDLGNSFWIRKPK